MGCAMSLEEKAALARSKQIDKYLAEEALLARGNFTLLLLGSGDSGKSTIMRQLRIIYGRGFTEEEFRTYRIFVYCNTIRSLVEILEAMPKLDVSFRTTDRKDDAKIVFDVIQQFKDMESFSEELLMAMKRLWADGGVQECFGRSNEYHIMDSAKYFLDNLDRIGMPNYQPTEQDFLRTYTKTTGINKSEFSLENFNFTIFDVGNVRCGNRREWTYLFENVTTIMFCVAMSQYNQVLYEDDCTNRMEDSIHLFDSICNNKWFTDTSIILFLNKMDIFKEKIKKFPLTICFPEYPGRDEYAEAADYIVSQFEAKNKSTTKIIYNFKTSAVEKESIQVAFDDIVKRGLHETIGTYY